MTENELKDFLAANAEDIKAAVKGKLIAGLLEQHRWQFTENVSTIVNEFIKDEIAPEVRKFLADQRGPMVEAAIKAAASVGDTIAQGMALHVTKNLTGDSYKFRQVMEALFKS
jgi:hypothetical protein